ncbi:MAG TPA: 2-amino-4-hydroxy-6-hydroxymethyldihydropteridine diphosphokinase [Coxiellaceae bacterium]|nr:2-amino-4-hydroxy-6-hydroxymethyldihydropteridine diphosphokinase [Coxiellaceae bacterium]
MSVDTYIALGSNLDHPIQKVQDALSSMVEMPRTRLIKVSRFYRTKPLAGSLGQQPDYINAVAYLKTSLSSTSLWAELSRIEQALGRVREKRWAARTIDLDILLYNDQDIKTAELTIPHPDMRRRDFVLYPLAEIAPHLVLPSGERIADLLAQCPAQGLTPLEA